MQRRGSQRQRTPKVIPDCADVGSDDDEAEDIVIGRKRPASTVDSDDSSAAPSGSKVLNASRRKILEDRKERNRASAAASRKKKDDQLEKLRYQAECIRTENSTILDTILQLPNSGHLLEGMPIIPPARFSVLDESAETAVGGDNEGSGASTRPQRLGQGVVVGGERNGFRGGGEAELPFHAMDEVDNKHSEGDKAYDEDGAAKMMSASIDVSVR
mmetsp:Transcript_65244/g.131225  ORF Transcript_65244/g.131225 Transcript_65244/m.131225 type:complete len:215 (-) Transcript_65244:644-1288(-)